jgi:hypothetical protein
MVDKRQNTTQYAIAASQRKLRKRASEEDRRRWLWRVDKFKEEKCGAAVSLVTKSSRAQECSDDASSSNRC